MRFHVPTKIFFGPGMIAELKNVIADQFVSPRAVMVTDQGIVEAGIAEKVMTQQPELQVFDRVEQNPKHSTIDEAGGWVRKIKPSFIIGLGGGSALDAAKAIALLGTNPGRIEEYEGREKYTHPPLPVVAVPTTCGTGSEVTWVSVVTQTERRFKMSIKGPAMFPDIALIDPDLLVTLPQSLIASTGMDALTHAVEAYTVKEANFITDIFARKASELIFDSIERAFNDIRGDEEAREKILLGSTLAGMAFGNSDVGAVHCLSEAVGSLYDTPHGVANSVFLPAVMEFNLPAVKNKYADIARIAGLDGGDKDTLAQNLIVRIKTLSRALGIPSLREIGVREDDGQEIAEKSFQNNSNPSNPREAAIGDYQDILKKMFRES